MANIEFAGFLFDALGVAVESATVDLVDRNTTTPVRATTTTDSNGYYTISHGTEGRFDIRITSGTNVLWRKYDTAAQMEELEVATLKIRNPADTFAYNILPAAIAANRTLNLPLLTGTDTLMALSFDQADQAAMEAETNEDTYAPPNLIKHSPGVPKVWVKWEQTGAHSIAASYNMTSVTDGGAIGDTDHLWNVDFSSAEYCLLTMSEQSSGTPAIPTPPSNIAAGGANTITREAGGTAIDAPNNWLTALGDQ